MRIMIAFSTAVVVTALTSLTAAALADKASEDAALKNAVQIQAMKAKQKDFCKNHRNRTPEKCNADFEATFDKMAQTTGWIVMYNQVNDGSVVPLAQMLHEQLVRSRANSIASIQNLERLYYPLPKASGAENRK